MHHFSCEVSVANSGLRHRNLSAGSAQPPNNGSTQPPLIASSATEIINAVMRTSGTEPVEVIEVFQMLDSARLAIGASTSSATGKTRSLISISFRKGCFYPMAFKLH